MPEEEYNKKLYYLVVILSIVLVLIAAALYVAGSLKPVEEHTISVSGSASTFIIPDMASISVGVVTQAATAKEASEKNAAAMTAVITALKNLGLQDKEIRTSYLSLQPLYNYSRDGGVPSITGYSASTDVEITTSMIGQIGDIVDSSIASGANNLGGISFVVSDEKQRQFRDELLANAVKDANDKASKLAESLNVRITGVKTTSISEGAPPYPITPSVTEKAGTTVMPGEFKVTLSVQVTYVIE